MKKYITLAITILTAFLSLNFYMGAKMLATESNALDNFVMVFNILFILLLVIGFVMVLLNIVYLVTKKESKLFSFSVLYWSVSLLAFNIYYLVYFYLLRNPW